MEQAGMQPESILIGAGIAIVASLVAAVVNHWLGAWRDRQRWQHERTIERERWEREQRQDALVRRVEAVRVWSAASAALTSPKWGMHLLSG